MGFGKWNGVMELSKTHRAGKVVERLVGTLRYVVNGTGFLGGLAIVIMMLIVIVDTLLRYIFNAPLTWGFEVDIFLMIAVVYVTLAYTEAQDGHIRVTLIYTHLPAKIQAILAVITRVIVLGVCVLFLWSGWLGASEALRLHSATVGIVALPLFPVKLLIPIAAFLMCLQVIRDIPRYIDTALGRGS